ncbi:SurA N-terminal domain-containing protein [Basilea psittacipulmonis]|uniref:Periplasmic chaperone PpiD n=1 Tax=Basilea psittacipulmonis DSM 24701 TaxID=1072685 RepID=A0A077DGJ1_9BURK|nr:SurA N-terminal domain-containing protein [Basilea psittacipulmonis]AIL32602.1 hypothetical protein IX83_04125 [Basilea psittacipulmonis DSM 24701]
MLEFIRRHQRVVLILLALLVFPSFIFFGVAGYTSFLTHKVVIAKVNDTEITEDQFKQAWNHYIESQRSELGANFDVSMIDTHQNRLDFLNAMINEVVTRDTVRNNYFRATTAMLRQVIASNPEFQENGVFSQEKYLNYLRSFRITAEQYENYLANNIALSQVLDPVVKTSIISNKLENDMKQSLTQVRKATLKNFLASDYQSSINVTDEEMHQWYEKNKDTLKIPETVDVSFILLNREAAEKQLNETVTEADLKQYYDQNIQKYGTPERREISDIILTIPASASEQEQKEIEAKAQSLAQEARKNPSKFAELAKLHSDDLATKSSGGHIGFISKDEFGVLSQAVYQASSNAVLDPILYAGAWHIVHIDKVEPAVVKSFDAVKESIKKEVYEQLLAEKFNAMATTLQDKAYEIHDELESIASAVGVPVYSIKGLTRDGLIDPEISGKSISPEFVQLFEIPRVRATVFSKEVLDEKQNSGVIEISPSEQLVLRVTQVTPAFSPNYIEAKPIIVNQLVAQKAMEKAKQAAEKYQGKNDKVVELSYFTTGLSLNTLHDVLSVPEKDFPKVVLESNPNGYTAIRVLSSSKLDNKIIDQAFIHNIEPNILSGIQSQERLIFFEGLRQLNKVKIMPEAEAVLQPES